MNRKSTMVMLSACLLLAAGIGPAAAARGKAPASTESGTPSRSKATESAADGRPDADVILDLDRRIRAHLFTDSDLKFCERKMLQSKDPGLKTKYLVLLARNLRINRNDPIACMERLGPVLLPEEKVAQWKQARAALLKTALDTWKKECDAARKANRAELPAKPAGLLTPFPAVEEWTVEERNAESAIEIARAHMDLRDDAAALGMADAVGRKCQGEGRVLAAECSGDLTMRMPSYAKAAKFYRFGLDVLQSLVSPGAGKSADQRAMEARLIAGLNEAGRLQEIEQYGAGYILYRHAEQKRLGEGAFLEALLLYEDLCRQFPKTVYSEAATAYSIDCLLALSDEENVRRAQAALVSQEKLLKEARDKLLEMKINKVDPGALGVPIAAMNDIESRLQRMKKTPLGSKAPAEARKRAAAFLEANPRGLYRGETLMRMADFALEHEYNVKEGLAGFEKACDWFDTIKDLDARADAFDVPSQAKAVSAPPPAMKYKDAWGNMEWTRPGIGKLFNRRTSAWYAPYHRMMAKTKRALCRFISGDRKKALEDLDIILQADEKERGAYQAGMPNSYSRLKSEFEAGRMFCTPEELAAFTGIERTALLVAEYYFELEKWEEAKRHYERLDKTLRPQLNRRACAYLDFMLGNCALMAGHQGEALKQFQKFETVYRRTPTWPRAMFGLYNLYQYIPEKKTEALAYLRKIHTEMPDTEFGQRAYFHEGEFWYANGKPDKAKPIFQECRKKYKGTWLEKGSEHYLAKMESEPQQQQPPL